MFMLWFIFILGSIFIFAIFWFMVMYDDKYKQRKRKIELRIKFNSNIYPQSHKCLYICQFPIYVFSTEISPG